MGVDVCLDQNGRARHRGARHSQARPSTVVDDLNLRSTQTQTGRRRPAPLPDAPCKRVGVCGKSRSSNVVAG